MSKVEKKIEKNNEKKSFTIRIDDDLEKQLERVGDRLNLKPATVARNYLQLAKYLLVKSDLETNSYDNTPMMMLPIEIFQTMEDLIRVNRGTYEKEIDLGDKFGIVINTNCEFANITDPIEKLKLAEGWGWFKLSVIDNYLAIPRTFGSLNTVNALVYRIVSRGRYPFGPDDSQYFWLNDKQISDWDKKDRDRVKGIRDRNNNEFGALYANYQDGAVFRYEKLKVKK